MGQGRGVRSSPADPPVHDVMSPLRSGLPPGPVYLLDGGGERCGVCPPETVRVLCSDPPSPEAFDVLDRYHSQRIQLLCPCERRLHVVQGGHPFLRRNPGQGSGGPSCALCESRWAGPGEREGDRPDQDTEIGLILRLHPHPEERAAEVHSRGRDAAHLRYGRAFGVLWRIMERAGFLSLGTSLHPQHLWEGVYRVLDAIPVDRSKGQGSAPLSQIAWTPGRRYRGGLPDLNRRLLREWPHRRLQPEGWTFGIVHDRPARTADRALVRIPVGAEYEYTFGVPAGSVAVLGGAGPYLALAVCSVNREGDPRYAKPLYHRLVLQAVARADSPVPVESGHERETVALLQERGLPFVKPMFGDPEGLRPDFILPRHGIVVEVQGMETAEYRARKEAVHRRLLATPRYRGFQLVVYRAREGESLAAFGRKLPVR